MTSSQRLIESDAISIVVFIGDNRIATEMTSLTKPLVGAATLVVGLDTVGVDGTMGATVTALGASTGAIVVVVMGALDGAVLDVLNAGTGAVVVVVPLKNGAMDAGTAVAGGKVVVSGAGVESGTFVVVVVVGVGATTMAGVGVVVVVVVGVVGVMTQPDWVQSPKTTKVTETSEPSNFKQV